MPSIRGTCHVIQRWRSKGNKRVGAILGLTLAIGFGWAVPPAGASATAAGASPGVTASSITVGQIDDLTAPIPGLFEGAKAGTEAYFAYINSTGGVNGRKIDLNSFDSTYTAATVAADAAQIASQDFAMVGGYSLLDAAEQSAIDANKLPDVSVPIAQSLGEDSNVYSAWPAPLNQIPLGPLKYFAKEYPAAVKHVGMIYSTEVSHIASTFISAATSVGWKFTYTRGYGLTETNFLPDAVKMKAAGVKLVFSFGSGSAATTAAFLKAAQQASFNPIEVQENNYFQALYQLAGPSANGAEFPFSFALFAGEDAARNPAVKLMDTWVHKVDPSYTAFSTDSMFGWASAELFVDALKQAGSQPTRATLVAALKKETHFSANGMLPPANVTAGLPSQCWLLAEMKNGKYQRVSPSPKTGFICSPGGLYQIPGAPKAVKR
jgi:ABC-type branched-subunit amino acid transport system substrate-binding protein